MTPGLAGTPVAAAMAAMYAILVVGGCSDPGAPAEAATQQIVFMEQVKPSLGAQGFELVAMNLDGSDRRQLTDNGEQEFLPHFSPDATRLVFTEFSTGGYGFVNSQSDVAVYAFGSETQTRLTHTGVDGQPVWSPDGARIAFIRQTSLGSGHVWVMNADGSGPHEIVAPAGPPSEPTFGDPAWSSDDWIFFVVAQVGTDGCFKTRVDKVRPDGTARTKVSDGGPNCTPAGKEQSGDADPGFSADGETIYSSRGFPTAPYGAPSGLTERRLYSFSSDAWYPGKPESDLSLAAEPSCIEGVPKGSPDGARVLLFRACFDGGAASQPGIYVTDTLGSYRTLVSTAPLGSAGVPGVFGPDWNPVAHK